MPVFQVSSRTVQHSGSPKKRSIRLRRWRYAVLRQVVGGLIFTVLAILLPVCTSFIWTPSQLSRLIHGTLLYDVLTIGLALIYFGGITTLAWAVMLAPLHTYVQSLIDQRFNRHYYEAARAIEAFSSTLREEIDLDKVRDGLLAVVQQTMHPQAVSVWVRKAVQPDMGNLPAHARQGENGKNDRQLQREGQKQERQEPVVDRLYGASPFDITVADHDPIIAFTLSHPGAVEVDRLQLDSLVLHTWKISEVEIALALVNQGELIGLLTLGPRLNGEEYGREDRRLLNTLAAQVAPALRVAQLVREQQVEVRERERIEQELRTAQDIQHAFLPRDVPALPGWRLLPYYQPAREVGGDFYDFLAFEDGQLGIVIGDVTDKGIPAALVMTATRTMLRTAALEKPSPGEVFARVNDLLYAEIPSRMFVTCFYAILDPGSGRMRYANAGHDLPYQRHSNGVSELWATGMPLGLMPGTCYEEHEVVLAPGDSLLFYSDGLVEAHNAERDMFGFPRLTALIGEHPGGPGLIDFLLNELATFTGDDWEQEDDVTLLALQRTPESLAMNEQQEKSHLILKSTLV